MRIAISKGSGHDRYAHYLQWLQTINNEVEMVDLISLSPNEAVEALSSVNGVLLSGGPDVDPSRYGQPEKHAHCGTIDEHRDELELAIIQPALELNLPILGICRGFQVLNVALGGTLVADIPSEMTSNIEHRALDDIDSNHNIAVEPGSMIKRITRTLDAEVNSAHHQGIEKLATLLSPSALSADGLIEAFEWGDAALGGKPFMLGVQWHPERMDIQHPMSGAIAEHFLQEVQAYSLLFR